MARWVGGEVARWVGSEVARWVGSEVGVARWVARWRGG